MKKIIIAAVFLLSISTAYAQLDFGVKAGYTSSISTDNLASIGTSYTLNSVQSEMWNNFHAGVFARVSLSKGLYLQPELLYAIGKKNYPLTPTVAVTGVDYNNYVTFSTVDIPLLLGYKVLDLKVANFRVFAGPKIRLNAGSQASFDNLSKKIDGATLIGEVKAAQLGLEGGVGIDMLKFTLDARYNLIGDMYKTTLNTTAIKNIPASTFVISLGWKLL